MLTFKNIIRILKYLLVIEILAACVVMLVDHPKSVLDVLLGSLIVSSPIILNFLLLLPFKTLSGTTVQIAFWSITGAYILNLGAAYYILGMFASSIIVDGTMGEGGGYWLLFTAGFAFKFSLVGAAIGALICVSYIFFKRPVNNGVN
jgi:hypothetical protein